MATKSKKEENRKKKEAYSSFYSVLSFLGSFVYLIVDIVSENNLLTAALAFSLLILSLILCEIIIQKLQIGIEQKNKKIMRWKDKLIELAQTVGCLSYLLLAITLLIAIIRFA